MLYEVITRYFEEGLHLQALSRAPAVAFDHRDDMHVSYLSQHFALPPGGYPCHTVRSSEAFIDLALAGVAYALIPELQIVITSYSIHYTKLYDHPPAPWCSGSPPHPYSGC